MYDTPSLFDAMAQDDSTQRVASRQALALAHTRVENKMGQFLRGAKTEDEFLERLALIQDDFDWHIKNASAEVGYDHPEYIQATLTDHYKLASEPEDCPNCGKPGGCDHEGEHHEAGFGETLRNFLAHPKNSAEVEFQETPAEEQEAEEQKESRRLADTNTMMAPNANQMPAQGQLSQTGLYTPSNGPSQIAQPINPATQNNPQMGSMNQDVNNTPETDPNALMQNAVALNAYNSKWVVTAYGESIKNCVGCNGSGDCTCGGKGCEKCGGSGTCPKCGGNGSYKASKNSASYPQHPQTMTYDEEGYPGGMIPDTRQPNSFQWEDPHDERDYLQQYPDQQYIDPLREFAPVPGGNPRGGGQIDADPSVDKSDYFNYIMQEPGVHMGARENPADQDDDSSRLVSCPQCGGNGKTANNGSCTKCAGKGKVPNFGDSMVDALGSKGASWQVESMPYSIRTNDGGSYETPDEDDAHGTFDHQESLGYEPKLYRHPESDEFFENGRLVRKPGQPRSASEGNTDLGGPEPKIDKDKQTETNPKKDPLGDEDKGRWPTKQKDITEPIKAENREVGGRPNDEVKEIGEKTTESVDLPAAKPNDSGFYDGGVTKQPAKSQWTGTDGQTAPVTHKKQAVYPAGERPYHDEYYNEGQVPNEGGLAEQQGHLNQNPEYINNCTNCGYHGEGLPEYPGFCPECGHDTTILG